MVKGVLKLLNAAEHILKDFIENWLHFRVQKHLFQLVDFKIAS